MADGLAGLGLDIRFSHVVISVSDIDRSLEFYRDVLGMDVVFDTPLSGAPFAGRAAGGVIGGVCVELMRLDGQTSASVDAERNTLGVQVLSLSVPSVDAAYEVIVGAVGKRAGKPFDVDGVRMFFVSDPDGTVVEFVEFPDSARTPAEMYRPVKVERP
jgi:catechol 2,3-dioxygenase-like lactoylglutathione lyase family enzyme